MSLALALSKIRESDVVSLTRDLVKIPSVNPPGGEREVAYALEPVLKSLGMDVTIKDAKPGRPNILGRLVSGRPGRTLLFNGHMDVVPPGDLKLWSTDPFNATVRDGRLYGRGTDDMKGGIAAMIVAIRAMLDAGLPWAGELLFTGVIDEETTGDGTTALVNEGIRADMAVIGEPTNLLPLRGHKGIVWLEITTRGTAVHSSTVRSADPKIGVNAIYEMSRVALALESFLPELEKRDHSLVGNPTISVGTIQGGNKTNTVPDTCTITVDRRLLPGEDPIRAKEEIDSVIRAVAAKNPHLKYDSRVIVRREGAEIPETEPIVRICRDAVAQVTGRDPGAPGSIATTDMAILVNRGGIPTVVLGPGRLSEAHIADEYVEIDQLVKAAKIYTAILSNALGR